jgi:hypothetical protein
MKKIILTIATVFVFGVVSAQDTKFGVKAGVDLASAKGGYSETGFFVGGFATIGISEKFAVQPEVLYVSIKDNAFLNIPILAKYSFGEKLSALAGPSLNYLLDAVDKELQFNIDFGAAYKITDNIDINAKYSVATDSDFGVNGIFIGAGYSF